MKISLFDIVFWVVVALIIGAPLWSYVLNQGAGML